MIYLSANGEVLGQFEEAVVPAMLKEGKITQAAFYWREGMPDWRPVAELQAPAKTEPVSRPAPPKALEAVQKQDAHPSADEKLVLPARPPVAAQGAVEPGRSSVATASLAPLTAPGLLDRVAAKSSEANFAAAHPQSSSSAAATPAPGGRSRVRIIRAVVVLLLALAAAGGAWWWINGQAPSIPGRVALSSDESGPVEIRVFRRADLAAPWQERLLASDARAAELEKVLADAQARHREKSLLYDEAARVCEVGEEYNMPDVEQLRADRDAKKADAEASKAELENLLAEKDRLFALETLLQSLPEPVSTTAAGSTGDFTLPALEKGDFVVLVTAAPESDGHRPSRGWLVIMEMPPDGSPPSVVEVSASNRLDVEAIRRFAGGYGPQ